MLVKDDDEQEERLMSDTIYHVRQRSLRESRQRSFETREDQDSIVSVFCFLAGTCEARFQRGNENSYEELQVTSRSRI